MATQPVTREMREMREMTDEQLQQHAFAVLARELGLADYARFLRLFGSGRGDYTADRQNAQAGMKLEEILQHLKNGEAATS